MENRREWWQQVVLLISLLLIATVHAQQVRFEHATHRLLGESLEPFARSMANGMVDQSSYRELVGGGDMSTVNSILGKLTLNLAADSLSEEPIAVYRAEKIAGFNIDLWFFFPVPNAVCTGVSVASFGLVGRYGNFKEFWPPDYTEEMKLYEDGTMKQQFFLDLIANGVTLDCTIPMEVKNNLNDNNIPNFTEADEGQLRVVVGSLNLNLTSLLYSGTNYTYLPPEFAEVPDEEFNTECKTKVDFEDLSFRVSGVDSVVVIPGVIDVDLNPRIEEQLNGEKKSIAQDPLEELLCDLTFNVSQSVGDLIVGLPFSNQTDTTYLTIPKGKDRIKEFRALELENSFDPPPVVDLADIGDNMLVDLIGAFPEDSRWISGEDPSESIFTNVYGFLLDRDLDKEGVDPVLAVLDYLLDTNFYDTGGAVTDLDVLKLAEDVLGKETVDASAGVSFDGVIDGAEDENGNPKPAVIINVTVSSVLMTITPRTDSFTYDRNWLDRIYLLGNQTLRLPAVEGFDVGLKVQLGFRVQFMGGKSLLGPDADPKETATAILEQIDGFTLVENLSIDAIWNDFFFETAVNLAVDQNAVRDLRIGTLARNLTDCLISTFYITPRLTDAVFNSDGFDMSIDGAQDSITYFVQEAANTLLPLFRGMIPGIAEELTNSNFVNTELIEPTVCNVPEDTGDIFSFEGTLMDFIQENVTPDTIATILDLVFPKGESGYSKGFNQIVTDPIELLNFEDLPSVGSVNVTLQILISKIEVKGLSPGNFSTFRFLEVNQTSPYYPSGLYNELLVGLKENPVVLALELELNTYPDRTFSGSRRRMSSSSSFEGHHELDLNNGFELTETQNAESSSRRVLSESDEQSRFLQTAPVPPPDSPTRYPTFEPTPYPSAAPTFPLPTSSPTSQRPTKSPTTLPPSPLPAGLQLNKVRISFSVEQLFALLDLEMKYFRYDVENTRLEDVLEFWCWMGKLQPYGGIKELAAKLINGVLDFECIECMNEVLQGLEERFQNPKASEEFFLLLNDILEYAAQVFEDFFIPKYWNTTVTDMQRWCEGLDSLAQEKEYETVKEDLTNTYAFLGMGVITVAITAFVNCCFLRSTHELDHEPLVKDDDEKKKADLAFLEQIDNNDHIAYELEHTTLFNHPCVPVFWRISIPLLLVINLVLFIIGHIGVAVTTSIVAGIAGLPIELLDFQSISVLQSAEAVWNSGGYLLAILIIVLSITWPYVKILGMAIAWFTPTRYIGFHKRGLLIKRLDQLGKWSLVELYLLLFILVTFRLEVSSPNNVYLPAGFYNLKLLINPKLSIYTFCTALVVSLLTSNFIEWFHEKVEKKVATCNRDPQKTDEMHLSMIEYLFPTSSEYSLGVSKLGTAILSVLILLSIIMIIVAAATPVLGTEVIGLARLVFELEEKETEQFYSLFRFLYIIFGSASPGELYLAAFFLLTVVVTPVLQLLVLLRMLLGRFTLDNAIFMYDVNVILSAWSCTEVFALGVAFTVLELGQISGSLVRESCASIQPIMENQLLALGLVDERDVQASCFTLLGSIEPGLYVLFVAMIISNIAHYFVSVGFMKFIQSRLALRQDKPRSGPAVTWLEKLLVSGRCMYRDTSTSTVAV